MTPGPQIFLGVAIFLFSLIFGADLRQKSPCAKFAIISQGVMSFLFVCFVIQTSKIK